MQQSRQILILWDHSHIWGLMAWRAVKDLGMRCRLVKAHEISQGVLGGKTKGEKHDRGILLVPGGSASLKARALGHAGLGQIREWLKDGGSYIGFCGGAGLALTHGDSGDSLALCPWRRAACRDRLQHLISGNMQVSFSRGNDSPFAFPAKECSGSTPYLPVWWPGRFAPVPGADVNILARYGAPMPDLWVGDGPLPLPGCGGTGDNGAEKRIFADRLRNDPVLVHGHYGLGQYILSYAHLETPARPCANSWLAHILGKMDFAGNGKNIVSEWDIDCLADQQPSFAIGGNFVKDFYVLFKKTMFCDERANSFPKREAWLYGWRMGLPGAVCNNLNAALSTLAQCPLSPGAEEFWHDNENEFVSIGSIFLELATKYMAATDMDDHTGDFGQSMSGNPDKTKNVIFGSAMYGGGLAGRLLRMIEELIWLSSRS